MDSKLSNDSIMTPLPGTIFVPPLYYYYSCTTWLFWHSTEYVFRFIESIVDPFAQLVRPNQLLMTGLVAFKPPFCRNLRQHCKTREWVHIDCALMPLDASGELSPALKTASFISRLLRCPKTSLCWFGTINPKRANILTFPSECRDNWPIVAISL